MKQLRKYGSVCLVLCMLLSLFPVTISEAKDTDTYSYTQNGSDGATIEFYSPVRTVSVDNPSIVSVDVNGSQIIVSGTEGMTGIATLTVTCENGIQQIQVPIGYTTFMLDDSTLTVYEGSDTKYEITGINSSDEEYTEDDADYPLNYSVDENGNKVYENTDHYSLLISIAKKGGTYVFCGESDDMAIAVKKEATAPATLLLCGLDLTSSFTAPVTVKKNSTSTVTITALKGHENTLTDADFNNADYYGDEEDGGDGTNVEYAESAVIKGKAYSNVTLNGQGTLNLVCKTKNAIKVGEYGSLTLEDLTLNVTSAKNGVSSDNILEITSGTYNITSTSDAIRTDPDAVGEDIGCLGNINISGGTFNLTAGSDGIQSAQDLTISGGDFNIQTGAGYNDPNFDEDTMSCKGLKASYNVDEETDTASATNTLTISGGTFSLNTADDAIHSDAYINISSGEYEIWTGDDGVHADTVLNLGTENGSDCAIHMTINSCYEGLEAGTVNIYSGCYDITSSDDGVNAAGGNNEDTTGFNPFPGGHFGNIPGNTSSNTNYSLNIYGSKMIVNAGGDGLDSNGPLNLTGGTQIVWNYGNGDAPLDCDGTLHIKGSTVFASGSSQMAQTPASSSQNYITSKANISQGKTINILHQNTIVFNIKTSKNVSYVLYSSPDITSKNEWSITVNNSELIDDASTWTEHIWNDGETTTEPTAAETGLITYTCTACGTTYTEIIPALDDDNSDITDGDDTDSECFYFNFIDCTSSWYHEAVDYTVANKLIQGTGNNKFEPQSTLTRAMVVTVLYRAAGSPEVSFSTTFTDIQDGNWYSDAITWAQEHDIVKGITETTFAPDEAVTRQQIAAILWRYANSPEVSTDLSAFVDADTISSYAATAMNWAVSEKLFVGDTDNALNPRANATRAEYATIIMRFLEGSYPCENIK